MTNVTELNKIAKPDAVALMSAIEDIIEEIATDNLTPLEVLGALDVISKSFYEKNLSILKIKLEAADVI